MTEVTFVYFICVGHYRSTRGEFARMRAFRDEFKADYALTSVFDERIERALRGVATHLY